jgi:hypothetical protein
MSGFIAEIQNSATDSALIFQGRPTMPAIKAIDELIDAGWQVLESDFDPVAFMKWRRRAYECVVALLGPDHPYALFFEQFVSQDNRGSLLTGAGILAATKEQVAALNSRAAPKHC